MKIGLGELDFSDRRAAIAYMRHDFFAKIGENAPEVFENLYNETFKSYQQIKPDYFTLPYIELLALAPQVQAVELFLSAITKWAVKWHMDAEWCYKVAYDAVRIWSCYPDRPSRLSINSFSFEGFWPEKIPAPPEGWSVYDPISTRREHYLNYVREQARKAIQDDFFLSHAEPSHQKAFLETIVKRGEEYCLQVEDLFALRGYKPVQEKREIEQHLAWAVQFQVKEMTLTEIAQESNVAFTTVKRAVLGYKNHNPPIQGVLEIIGLDRRPNSRPGRRHGSKTSSKVKSIARLLRELG